MTARQESIIKKMLGRDEIPTSLSNYIYRAETLVSKVDGTINSRQILALLVMQWSDKCSRGEC